MIIKNPLIIKKAKLQTKAVTPKTTSQTITADSGYDGLNEVEISAVTSSIDSNITAENIKKDVTILGVTGTLESGGGILPDETKPIRLYDYDGTLLYSYTNEEIRALTTLPTPPEHDRLTFQEWNWSLSDLQTLTTEMNVGATYTTTSGESEFDIELTTVTGLTVTLNMDGTKDWGDGSTPNTATTHTYSSVGTYTIKCNGTSITASSSSGAFGQSSSSRNYYVKNIRLSKITTIASYALFYCLNLKSITIPSSVTTISSSAFYYCSILQSIIIPSLATNLGTELFYACSKIKLIIIPNKIKQINNYAYRSCSNLTSITIPASVTSIGSYAFNGCTSLTSITIPASVTSIDLYAFYSDTSLIEYDLSLLNSVPTLNGSDVFTNINQLCKIKVKSSLLSDFQTATNWSTYANYMVGV